MIIKDTAIIDDILEDYRSTIGSVFNGYRNHVYRMVNCTLALLERDNINTEENRQKVMIAAAFHDIGLWTDKTLAYLEPSVPHAIRYLEKHDLMHLETEIVKMITEHHKVTAFTDGSLPLVEYFRKGDLVDFSLGMIRFGLEKSFLRELKATFPNAGFHRFLLVSTLKWLPRHPLSPAPMMKW